MSTGAALATAGAAQWFRGPLSRRRPNGHPGSATTGLYTKGRKRQDRDNRITAIGKKRGQPHRSPRVIIAANRNFTAGLHIFLFSNNNLVRTKRDSYWEQFFRIISKIRRSLYKMNHQVDKSPTNFSKFADFTWEHLSGITSSGIRVSDSNSTTFSPMIPFCSV